MLFLFFNRIYDWSTKLPDELKSLFSLSYNYFTILGIVVSIGLAFVISLITKAIGIYYPDKVAMFNKPTKVNRKYLAFSNFLSNDEDQSNFNDDQTVPRPLKDGEMSVDDDWRAVVAASQWETALNNEPIQEIVKKTRRLTLV